MFADLQPLFSNFCIQNVMLVKLKFIPRLRFDQVTSNEDENEISSPDELQTSVTKIQLNNPDMTRLNLESPYPVTSFKKKSY